MTGCLLNGYDHFYYPTIIRLASIDFPYTIPDELPP